MPKFSDLGLTKDAQAIAIKMFKNYKKLKKNSEPESKAFNWGTADMVLEIIGDKWSREDVVRACKELENQNIIEGFRKKNELVAMRFTPNGIATLQSVSKERIDNILKYANQLKGLLS